MQECQTAERPEGEPRAAAMRWPVPAQARFKGLCLSLLVLVLAALPTAAPAAEVLHGQGLLWRIEREDTPPSHVFGTVHSADPQVVDLPLPVADALAASADVVLEVVQTDETSDRTLRAGLLRPDQDLRSILGEDLFEQVAVVGNRYGLPAPQLRRFKPWLLIMLFSVPHSELARRATRESEIYIYSCMMNWMCYCHETDPLTLVLTLSCGRRDRLLRSRCPWPTVCWGACALARASVV
jgi:hypothetical protein